MRPSRLIRETFTLKDGRRVVLRPIDPRDADGLIDFHSHLSPDSRYYRFFSPKPRLTRSEAEYLANVDFRKRFAIVAEDDRRIVAVGRFDIVGEDLAEPAIVVRDDYQGQGLAKAILRRMLDVARGRGITRFSGEVLADNARMLDLLRSADLEVSRSEDGVVRVSSTIERSDPMEDALAAVARYAAMLTETAGSVRDRAAGLTGRTRSLGKRAASLKRRRPSNEDG